MPVRLLVADPQPVVRAGLFTFFNNVDVQIVDNVQTCEQLIANTLALWPDVVILDAVFPDGSGFDAVMELRKKRYTGRILFFEASGRQTYVARALAVGADSYRLKSTPRADLVECVLALANAANDDKLGKADANVNPLPEYAGELLKVSPTMRKRNVDPLNPLTDREAQVLRHVALGLSNKEIAFSLRLSVDTVKEHVQNILRKLDVNDRTQAAVWAVRNKQIP